MITHLSYPNTNSVEKQRKYIWKENIEFWLSRHNPKKAVSNSCIILHRVYQFIWYFNNSKIVKDPENVGFHKLKSMYKHEIIISAIEFHI